MPASLSFHRYPTQPSIPWTSTVSSVRLMMWSWPMCSGPRSSTPPSPLYPSSCNLCQAPIWCIFVYTNSFHTWIPFRAHRHSMLDRNTRILTKFVCLGKHAYCLCVILMFVCFCFSRFFCCFLWALGVTLLPLMEIDPRYRTQRNQGRDDYLEAQLNNMEFSADCLMLRNTWPDYQ
jgi:hypothetical protein